MIQRLQSLFLFFSTVSLLVIVYYFPLLKDSSTNVEYYLKNSSSILRYLILASSILSVFAIFQFRNRNKQKIVKKLLKTNKMQMFYHYRMKLETKSGLTSILKTKKIILDQLPLSTKI